MGWATRSVPVVFVVVRQVALHDLARGVAGELVDEDPVLRDLEVREVRLDVLLQRVLVDLAVLDDEGLQRLAELLVVDADDRRLADVLVLGERLLDLLWEDVLPARDDHVVVAALDVEAAVLVEVADVARGHEPVDHVLRAAAGVASKSSSLVTKMRPVSPAGSCSSSSP